MPADIVFQCPSTWFNSPASLSSEAPARLTWPPPVSASGVAPPNRKALSDVVNRCAVSSRRCRLSADGDLANSSASLAAFWLSIR